MTQLPRVMIVIRALYAPRAAVHEARDWADRACTMMENLVSSSSGANKMKRAGRDVFARWERAQRVPWFAPGMTITNA